MKNSITEIFSSNGHFLSEDESTVYQHRLGELLLERLPAELPLKSPERTWELLNNPKRIRRAYSFEDYSDLQTFVAQILSYQQRVKHHGQLTVTHDTVAVEVYTHDIDDVTDLDIEYSKELDELYGELGKIARYNRQRDEMNRMIK